MLDAEIKLNQLQEYIRFYADVLKGAIEFGGGQFSKHQIETFEEWLSMPTAKTRVHQYFWIDGEIVNLKSRGVFYGSKYTHLPIFVKRFRTYRYSGIEYNVVWEQSDIGKHWASRNPHIQVSVMKFIKTNNIVFLNKV